MIDDRTLQRALAARGHYAGPIDGRYGDLSRRAARLALIGEGLAIADWIDPRCRIALEQSLMAEAGIETGAIDGLAGPQTRIALEQWQDRLRSVTPRAADIAHQPAIFPRQRDVRAYFGEPGQNQKLLSLPFPMKLAWDHTHTMDGFFVHEKVHVSAARAFNRILDLYGGQKIVELGLDLFGGSLNVRNMRGGKKKSMHSWGIAIDFDPAHNALRWGRDRARMAGPDYAAFLDIWEEQGWISLGRERNYDWMHVQAARL
ncbi:MAG: M15 family metallopeptidase [Parasphingopyxis sp.]